MRLSDMPESELKQEIPALVLEIAQMKGNKMKSEDLFLITETLIRKLSTTFRGYTPQDLRNALTGGVLGEFGGYYGLYAATFVEWLEKYKGSKAHQVAIEERQNKQNALQRWIVPDAKKVKADGFRWLKWLTTSAETCEKTRNDKLTLLKQTHESYPNILPDALRQNEFELLAWMYTHAFADSMAWVADKFPEIVNDFSNLRMEKDAQKAYEGYCKTGAIDYLFAFRMYDFLDSAGAIQVPNEIKLKIYESTPEHPPKSETNRFRAVPYVRKNAAKEKALAWAFSQAKKAGVKHIIPKKDEKK